ncbi:MAG: hypothetical protein HY661_22005 [Betaproteobacteria bacterium]|nr:hypothetical protein [Betaproteobacteria bacterium]
MSLQQLLGTELPIIQAPMAGAQGSGDFSPLWAGQNASGSKEVPAAEITRELAAGLPAGFSSRR